MIPIMIMFGMAFGWWWRWALLAGAVVWPLMLWPIGIYDDAEYATGGTVGMILGAAVLGAANTGVGVAINRGLVAVFGRGRSRRSTDVAETQRSADPEAEPAP